MPVMDGYEATRCVRLDSRFAHLPIIAMTAHAMQEEGQKILEAGMDAHITKPINTKTMLQTIKLFLGKQEYALQHQESIADATGDTFELPDITGIDVTEALINLDGDRKLYLWVLETFIEQQTETSRQIAAALGSGDTDLAIRTAHTIKGCAGNIGAKRLVKLACTLENTIAQGSQAADILLALDDFSTELNRLIDELKNWSKRAFIADETLPKGSNTGQTSKSSASS